MSNNHDSWMLENGMGCTGTQILHLKPRNPGAQEIIVQSRSAKLCTFSLSNVGILAGANLAARLSKICMARSKNLFTTRARQRELANWTMPKAYNNLGSICMSSC
uniref:Uncharacterized protein n=1 Tax=Setaria italica TaxID=4555 RepID=K3ZB20_SETIT